MTFITSIKDTNEKLRNDTISPLSFEIFLSLFFAI